MKGIAGVLDQMSKRFGEMSKAAIGSGTIIVHPQLSETEEEAKELDEDWGKREKRQLRDNLSDAMKRRR